MKARVAALAARFARGARRMRALFPLTLLGAFTLALSTHLLVDFAIAQDDFVALVVGWVGIALVGLAFVAAALGLLLIHLALRRKRPGQELRFETDARVPTGFSLPALGWVPLVGLETAVVEPESLQSSDTLEDGARVEQLSARERGVHASLRRSVRVGDVFGLVRVDLTDEEPRSVVVTPHLGALAQLPTLTTFARGDTRAHPTGSFDGDRVDVRRYAPGDAARHIHWPVYARTRKLVVRVRERAIAPTERVVAYLAAGPRDEASAAAALAALRFGALGSDWSFGADGTPRPTSDEADAVFAVARSAEHRDDGACDLDAFLRDVEKRGPCGLLLFAPASKGPWLERVEHALRGLTLPARVVIGVDGLEDPAPRSLVRRLLVSSAPTRAVPRAALEEVTERLARLGCLVTVVDRPTGRVLSVGGARAADLAGRAA